MISNGLVERQLRRMGYKYRKQYKNLDKRNTDGEQWNQLRAGKRAALDAIDQAWASPLFRYGSKFTTDRDLVKDCIHDMFVELWQRHRTLGPTNSIRYYLLRMLRRRLARHAARQAKSLRVANEYHQRQSADLEFDWLLEEKEQWRRSTLQKLIDALPPRQREIIYLRFYHGFSFDEAADILEIDTRSAICTVGH